MAATPPRTDDVRLRRKGIIAFLAIAFGLTWIPFLAIPLGLGSYGTVLMPFAPAIACFVVRKWVTREGFGDAGLRPNLRRWPLYLLALAWPLAVHPLRVLLALLLGTAPPGFTFPWGLAAPSPLSLLTWALLPLAAAPLFFGEEFGWRGYLQLRLLADKPMLAAVATGVIWGVWHYPLALLGGGPVPDVALSLLLYPLGTTVSSVLLGWLRLRTGDVWASSVAHGVNNGITDRLARLAFTGGAEGTLPGNSAAPSLLAEALVFGAIVAGDRLRRRKRTTASSVGASALSPGAMGWER
jgi:membrane protease YdiL (CAAX protease family)